MLPGSVEFSHRSRKRDGDGKLTFIWCSVNLPSPSALVAEVAMFTVRSQRPVSLCRRGRQYLGEYVQCMSVI